MPENWLAQNEIADWIEGIVFLVVIVLAALGNLTKALTRKVQQAKEQRKSDVPRPQRPEPARPAPAPARPVARPRPPRPIARPAPRRETREVSAGPAGPSRRFGSPDVDSLPEMLREVFGQLKEKSKPRSATTKPKPAPPKPVAKPQAPPPPPRPRTERRRSAPARTAKRTRTDRKETPPEPPKPVDLRERHLAEFHTSFDPAGAVPAATETTGLATFAEASGSIRLPTAAEMRRAVVMREILSPPLALRDPDASGF